MTGSILFILGWHVNKREQQLEQHGEEKLPFFCWEIMLSLFIFAVVAGARYHTGFDHAMYLEQYEHLQKTGEFSRQNFEFGFEWISKIFAFFHIHYFFYFAFWALLQIGFLYFGLRNHKHLLCWVGLGIMCGSYFLGWMNSVRQSVVVCLFVALVSLIKERKFLPYFIIIIAAAFIHKSALLMLPVFLLTFVNVDAKVPNQWLLLTVVAAFVLLGMKPFWINYFNDYQWFLNLTGYENYGNLDDPNVGGQLRTLNWGPSRVSILLANVLIIWYYGNLKAFFKNDKLLPFFFWLAFIGMCLSNLLMNTTHYILRPIEYFTIFYLVMGSYLMVYFVKNKKYRLAILLSFLLYSHFLVNIYKAVYMPSVTNSPFLYHTFLLTTIK
ncbi:MAG: EpsG family protein [Muribaculaceae bacterium]|nr:EpsG family protein [Muribaculaceae bacterium]